MPQYYTHIDGQQQGPYTLQQAQDLQLPPHTMVWQQGTSGWLTASSFPQLQQHLHSTPPPIGQQAHRSSNAEMMEMLSSPKPRKHNSTLAIFILAPILVASISYNNYRLHETKYAHIQERLDAQRGYIDEQYQDIDDQEDIAETILQQQVQHNIVHHIPTNPQQQQQRLQLRAARLQKLQDDYHSTLQQLAKEQEQLQDIQAFQLLRRRRQKERQVSLQHSLISSIQRRAAIQQAAILRYQTHPL